MMEWIENRLSARLEKNIKVFYYEEFDYEKKWQGLTKNISRGGICLMMGKEIPEHSKVLIEVLQPLSIEHNKTIAGITLVAETIWKKVVKLAERGKGSKGFLYGMQFCEYDENQIQIIEDYINRSLEESCSLNNCCEKKNQGPA